MAKINISETQIAFGFLHSYINVFKPRRFLLPSIRQEGGIVRFPYPGADLIIDNNWLIQFKRPEFFITAGIKEFWNYDRPDDFEPPYYRFYIKNNSPTNQFEKLIDATKSGFNATYISPAFTDDNQFFSLLNNDKTHLGSYAYIDLGQFDGIQTVIGKNNDHTILYTLDSLIAGFCYCFSEPHKMIATKSFEKRQNNNQNISLRESVDIILNIFFPELKREAINVTILQRLLLIRYGILWVIELR